MNEVWKITGIDAIELLNRISTLHLQSVPLQGQEGLILNSSGKIETSFWVKKTAPDQLEIRLDPLAVNRFTELLDHYTFSEKYQIEKSTTSDPIYDADPNRIEKLQPRIGSEFLADGQTNPLDINLKSAIHDQKGCYPGQEVVEKIIALGSPAKRLVGVRFPIPSDLPTPPIPLYSETPTERTIAVGQITSWAKIHSTEAIGLAVVRRTHQKVGQVLFAAGGLSITIDRNS